MIFKSINTKLGYFKDVDSNFFSYFSSNLVQWIDPGCASGSAPSLRARNVSSNTCPDENFSS